MLLFELNAWQLVAVALVYIWTGFVRSGLGFGGAALGLPLMLLLVDNPIFWLPIIGSHLLFFSSLTVAKNLRNVDWPYLLKTSALIVPATLAGVFGLLNLPNQWLLLFIYSVTLFYAVTWVLSIEITSQNIWIDRVLLVLGGYIAGTSLTGAPLIVAVFVHNVVADKLRNTLFVLWFSLVSIKMATFVSFGVDLQWQSALILLPFAAVGHWIGLSVHQYIVRNNQRFKRVIGVVLILICILALLTVF